MTVSLRRVPPVPTEPSTPCDGMVGRGCPPYGPLSGQVTFNALAP